MRPDTLRSIKTTFLTPKGMASTPVLFLWELPPSPQDKFMHRDVRWGWWRRGRGGHQAPKAPRAKHRGVSRRINLFIMHWTHYLFSDWPRHTVNFWNQCLWCHLAADYTIIMSRTLKVTGSHVIYDLDVWFLRVIMSSSHALCCLPSLMKQMQDFLFFYVQSIIKQSESEEWSSQWIL